MCERVGVRVRGVKEVGEEGFVLCRYIHHVGSTPLNVALDLCCISSLFASLSRDQIKAKLIPDVEWIVVFVLYPGGRQREFTVLQLHWFIFSHTK